MEVKYIRSILVTIGGIATSSLGCNVSSQNGATSGISPTAVADAASDATGDRDGDRDGNGDGDSASTPAPVCPRAVLVVGTDYASTNVSALSASGVLLSPSLLSSGSATVGLSTPLSGDVGLPANAPASPEAVVVDRTNSSLLWVSTTTATVTHELSVATGFQANPHDFLQVASDRGYVSRYNSNGKPGMVAFDAGSDLLVIDLTHYSIQGRIDLSTTGDGPYFPSPDRMAKLGDQVWVLLQRYDAGPTMAADGRIAGIDIATNKVAWSVDLPGVASCGGLAVAPAQDRVAVSCSGVFSDTDPKSRSGIVLLDTTQRPPKEVKRFPLATSLGAQLSNALSYANDHLIVGTTFGDSMAHNDLAFVLDTTTGMAHTLVDSGKSFVLGDVLCTPRCSGLCMIADAAKNQVRMWQTTGDAFQELAGVSTDPMHGLPPRSLGAL